MKKILSLLMAAALWLGTFAPATAAVRPDTTIPVIHVFSKVLTKAELAKAIAAVQIQIDRDFYPAWGYRAKLSLVDTPGAWQFELTDDPDWKNYCMCWGFHDVTSDGLPVGIAFLAAVKEYPFVTWSMVLSHEILEMLADPRLDQVVVIDGVVVAIEDADQVNRHGYRINGVLVQDFVLPNYYVPGTDGPWDFLKLLSGPFPACQDENEGRGCNITIDNKKNLRHDPTDF